MCLRVHTSQQTAKRLGLVSWANHGQELGDLTVASSADLCKSKTKKKIKQKIRGRFNITQCWRRCGESYSYVLMVSV